LTGLPLHDGLVEAMVSAYIGLGANVGEPRAALVGAVAALDALPRASVVAVSRLYRTRPVGPVEQADFLNAVVALQVPTSADPERAAIALLIALKNLEGVFGRQKRERWGPREIDLDLLLFGEHALHVERADAARSGDPARSGAQWLDVPHRSAHERLFVLAPLADLAPDLAPPGWGKTVAEAAERARDAEGDDAVDAVAIWDPDLGEWTGSSL
jgi:2-amino-4-hydroxy-6-hydroxymethyldihydropteridine diphosphokinase